MVAALPPLRLPASWNGTTVPKYDTVTRYYIYRRHSMAEYRIGCVDNPPSKQAKNAMARQRTANSEDDKKHTKKTELRAVIYKGLGPESRF